MAPAEPAFSRIPLPGGGEQLRFLAPDGRPLSIECRAHRGFARLRLAARRAGVDWLHGLALAVPLEGGIALVGVDGPGPRQLLRLRPGAEGIDVEGVRAAAEGLLAEAEGGGPAHDGPAPDGPAPDGPAPGGPAPGGPAPGGPALDGTAPDRERPGADGGRAGFESALARAGALLPEGAGRALRSARGRRLYGRALLRGAQAVGEDHATEWRPSIANALRADPAHLWLRPRLGFVDARPEIDFCTSAPTAAEVAVLGLRREWAVTARDGRGRRRLRLGVLLHPLGTTLVLLSPDANDLVVVVHGGDLVRWTLYDPDDYRAAFLDRRRPPVKDTRVF